MAGEQGEGKTTAVPVDDATEADARPSFDPRYLQRNLASRLFPGPSKLMSDQNAQHLERLLKSGDREALTRAIREQRERGRSDNGSRPSRGAVGGRAPAPSEPSPAAADDVTKLQETLDAQNELLRAILASTVDTQTDARATAQNSRTFAWAGTAIALLTLIATVISVVAAVRGT